MTTSIGQLVGKIYDLLKELDETEKEKVLEAVGTLCGIKVSGTSGSKQNKSNDVEDNSDYDFLDTEDPNLKVAQYFSKKAPKTKVEKLAVAARFSEKKTGSDSLDSKGFASIFSEARQNFDAKNFGADIWNAKVAGLFVKGAAKSRKHKLSYNGQNFVDALPDREAAAKHLKKTTKRKAKKRTSKAKKTKKNK